MADSDVTPYDVAEVLQGSVGLLFRRLKQIGVDGDLPTPARAALSRLQREGPATSAELARAEQVTPQSMGATLKSLEADRLIERTGDPADGRRVVLTITPAGVARVERKRSARTEQLATALSSGFTAAELDILHEAAPLIVRLARGLR